MDCLLCRIVARTEEASVVYEDDRVIAISDLYAVNPGHLLVITKAHAVGLDDLNGHGWLSDVRRRSTTRRCASPDRPRREGINLFLADGEAAFQDVFHVHLHVIPRHSGTTSNWTPASRPLRRPAGSLTPSRAGISERL